ncbi:MAG: N-acetylmuramoyl-L-alanine amidase [Peptostreptococcaceae bacterium]
MSKRINKIIIKSIAMLSIISALPILGNVTFINANETTEKEFLSVIEGYSTESVIVENGISLKMGEILDLSKYPQWDLSNKNTVKIDNKGILNPINEGSVFLSKEIDDKLYVLEVYISNSKPQPYSTFRSDSKERAKREHYKVFIDPGHGGSDNGAGSNGLKEDELNLKVSLMLRNKLEAKGIEVQMSRTTDVFIELSERANMANRYGADVFVSVHQNSASATSASGIETYHHSNKINHKPLSDEIQVNAIEETSANNRKVKSANFVVLRESNMPSALFESGFITNVEEAKNLADPTYQDKLATAIANGVEVYLKQNVSLGQDEIAPPTEIVSPDAKLIDIGTIKGLVGNDKLNVRSGYGSQYSVIGTLQNDAEIDIYESKNGWHKINYNGVYGYVSSTYVKIEGFTDTNNHWAKSQIKDFVLKGYINGYSNGTFKPDESITRAEFIKLVNRTFNYTSKGSNSFKDVKSDQWYYDEVLIAINHGYINGYSDNTFKPNEKISREEVAKIIATITNKKGDGVLNFKDSKSISDWAKQYVDAVSDNSLMGGYDGNLFKAKASITRAESVTTLSRIN